jgi:hypothetical protein
MSAPVRKTVALPPRPSRSMSTGELLATGGVVLGVGALAWYLLKKPAPVMNAAPTTLPDWAMT